MATKRLSGFAHRVRCALVHRPGRILSEEKKCLTSLSDSRVGAAIAVSDMAEAKAFDEGKLGSQAAMTKQTAATPISD